MTSSINPGSAQALVATELCNLTGKMNENLNQLASNRADLLNQSLENDFESAGTKVTAGIFQAVGTGVQGVGAAGMSAASTKEAIENRNLGKEFDAKFADINNEYNNADEPASNEGISPGHDESTNEVHLSKEQITEKRAKITQRKEKIQRDLEEKRSTIKSKQTANQNWAQALQLSMMAMPQAEQQVMQAEGARHDAASKVAQGADQSVSRLYENTKSCADEARRASDTFSVSVAMARG